MILKILILVLIFIIVPFAVGLIPTFSVGKSQRTSSAIYLCGLIMCLALFQLITVPIVIFNAFGFDLIMIIYSIILALASATGIALAVVKWKKEGNIFAEVMLNRNLTIEEIIEWVLFAGFLVFQIVMFVRMSSFDGDDAYYVVESLLSQQTGTLYRILPYTGLSTSLDMRHSLAVFPIWIAYIAKAINVHATIVSHSIMGYLLIPATYLVYLEIGRNILKKERNKLPVFMIFVSIMQVFGNVSIYTSSTFLLTRTWQGKSLLANICIPATIWLLLIIFDSEKQESGGRLGFWITLFGLNIVAAMCSTSSVFLIAMLIGLSGLVLSIKEKNTQILLRLIITCVPLVVYGVLYLLL